MVTDLHYAVTKEHRLNYFEEVMSILSQILEIREAYSKRGYTVSLIFLGDVIDGPIMQAEDAMRCQNLFRYYAALFKNVYSVLGNHEANNVKSNPFWFLVSELGDPELLDINKALQPQAVEPIFKIPATLTDGDVTFYFNHYGLDPKVPEKNGVTIGLFHQNVGSNDICKMWGTFADVEEAAFMQGYNYSFLGHMHLAVGKYYLNAEHTCVGEWLGTCVGTNVTEVESLDRKCNIPAILVEDGKFISVEDNYILRSDPSTSIDYAKLKVTQTTAEMVKEIKSIATATAVGDSLYSMVRNAAANAKLEVLVDLISSGDDVAMREYKYGLEHTLVTEESNNEC